MTIKALYPNSLPSLSLDFANTKALDPRITFARASSARVYDGKTVAKAEENLLIRSQEFFISGTPWVGLNVTGTEDATAAPDGTSTADKIIAIAASGNHRTRQTIGAAGTYVFSAFAKAAEYSRLALGDGGTTNVAVFDLTAGTVTPSGTVSNASITAVANGFFRCVVTVTLTTSGPHIWMLDNSGSFTFTGNGTDGLFLWGAQLEQRSAVTAYTPTTTQRITNYVPVLLSAANNVARFDHNPVTGESLGLLIEEQRTNLLLRSEEFNDAAWTKTRLSVVANTIVAPDGTLTGSRLVEDTQLNVHWLAQSGTITAGAITTSSVYLKQSELNRHARILLSNVGANSGVRYGIDLTNGTLTTPSLLGTGSAASATITPVGNGWYRVSVSGIIDASSTSVRLFIYTSDTVSNGLPSYQGNGYSGLYIWGAQLEAGAFPTSYIPTVASQVTRSADVASMTGANFSSWYSADNVGSMYVEANEAGGVTSGPWWLNNGTSLRGIAYRRSVATNNLEMNYRQPDGSVRNPSVLGAIPYGQSNKVAASFDAANTSVSANGATAVSSSSSNLYPAVDQLRIGFAAISGNSPYVWCGTIKKLAFYPRRLANAELQALTQI